ncbi:hypothetical protein HanIR_Chr15g0732021 [Helianthus annuus]|nr:hypothetical protein HanIR_Chr15g0732021 [Helianthus annuus]
MMNYLSPFDVFALLIVILHSLVRETCWYSTLPPHHSGRRCYPPWFLKFLDEPSPSEQLRRLPQLRVTGPTGESLVLSGQTFYQGHSRTETIFVLTGVYYMWLCRRHTSWGSGLSFQFLPRLPVTQSRNLPMETHSVLYH